MTVEVLSPPVTNIVGGTESWVGCLSGAFNVPGDWTVINGGFTISGNQGHGTGLGYTMMSLAVCGSALDQEVVGVFYQVTSGGAGNTGYRYSGPSTRMAGTLLANHTGYSFECGFVSGTNPATCNGNTLNFALIKWNAGVQTNLLTSFNLAGPTLTQGTTFRLVTRQVGANANNKCYLNADLIYDHTDTSPLGAGRVGFSDTQSCGGISPADVIWQYVKARNL
jgi:hypothetical protein